MQIVLTIIAYLLGSIPTAVWLGKWLYHIDVRDHGSGNAGATNTFRTLGPKAGIPVLLFDVLKGYGAVQLALIVKSLEIGSPAYVGFQLVLGGAALLGHIFPLYAGFRGGKGIATLLGFMLAVEPIASLMCIGVFVLILLTTRIVSISSMSASIAFPIFVLLLLGKSTLALVVFALILPVLVIYTHRTNIQRLINREESRVTLRKSKE